MLDEFLGQIYQNVDQCKKELDQVCNKEIILKRLDNCREHARMYVFYKKQSNQNTRDNTNEKNKENINAGIQTSYQGNRQIDFDFENINQEQEVISDIQYKDKQKSLQQALSSIKLTMKDDPSSIKFDSTGKTEEQSTFNILSKMKNEFDQLDQQVVLEEYNSQYEMSDFTDNEDAEEHDTNYYKDNSILISKIEFMKLLEQNKKGANHNLLAMNNSKIIPLWALDQTSIQQQSYQQFTNKSYLKNFGKLQHFRSAHNLNIFNQNSLIDRYESDVWTPQNSKEKIIEEQENQINDSGTLNQTNFSENIEKYQLTYDHYQKFFHKQILQLMSLFQNQNDYKQRCILFINTYIVYQQNI